MSAPAAVVVSTPHRAGLEYWMRRALKECERARLDFAPDPVHDLRVALRRCRTLADGLMALDPHPGWRKMRKAARKLFRRLGELRDLQVTIEWVSRLSPAGDPVREQLLPLLVAEEQRRKTEAKVALDGFDLLRWQHWARVLPRRARRVAPDSPAFEHLALEHFEEAAALHRRAFRIGSDVALHRLRIGLKRFRYTVENFMPGRAAWLPDLKRLQDLLGEIHDLDVLRTRYFTRRRMFAEPHRARWRAWIAAARADRLGGYRARMAGPDSLWSVWRAGLPSGDAARRAGMAKLRAWAAFLDPRPAHSRRVLRLALALFDAFRASRNGAGARDARSRRILEAAALLHEIGRGRGARGHHKAAYRMIRDFPPPCGWTAAELRRAALVARYHRGAEPRETHRAFHALPLPSRRRVTWLAGLLRLADGLASVGRVSRIRVELHSEAVFLWARGYEPDRKSAALIGDRTHLLASALGQPLFVRPWPSHRHQKNVTLRLPRQ